MAGVNGAVEAGGALGGYLVGLLMILHFGKAFCISPSLSPSHTASTPDLPQERAVSHDPLRFGSASLRDISGRVNDGGLNRVVANATGTGFSLEKHAIGWNHVDPAAGAADCRHLASPAGCQVGHGGSSGAEK